MNTFLRWTGIVLAAFLSIVVLGVLTDWLRITVHTGSGTYIAGARDASD